MVQQVASAREYVRLAGIFGVDLRGLAVGRILIALVILLDLWRRSGDFVAHYTDAGILPRADLLTIHRFSSLSLHLLSGEAWFQSGLFVLHAAAAMTLLFGWQTRWATLACWVFTVSLQSRNWLLLDGGDDVLRHVLFWLIFLPAGARWSIDACRRPVVGGRSPTYVSLASAALLLQMANVYFMAAVLKSPDRWIFAGDAMHYALHLDHYTTPLGPMLLAYPTLLRWTSPFVYFAELMLPFAFFVSAWGGWVRAAALLALVAFHISIGLTFYIGLFPLTCCVVLTMLLPTSCWDMLLPRTAGLPARTPSGPGQNAAGPSLGRRFNGLPRLLVVLALALATLSAAARISGVYPPGRLGSLLNVAERELMAYQNYCMFSPVAPAKEGWFVLPARLADGRSVDLYRPRWAGDAELHWDRPTPMASAFPNQRWRKYYERVPTFVDPYADRLLRYFVRVWDRGHPDVGSKVVSAELVYLEETTPPPTAEAVSNAAANPATGAVERHTLARYAAAPVANTAGP